MGHATRYGYLEKLDRRSESFELSLSHLAERQIYNVLNFIDDRLADKNLMPFGSAREPCRKIYRCAQIVAFALKRFTVMDPYTDSGKLRLEADELVERSGPAYGCGRFRKSQHKCVTDLFYNLPLESARRLADHLRIPLQNVARYLVAMYLGQRGKTGQVREGERYLRLPWDFSLAQ